MRTNGRYATAPTKTRNTTTTRIATAHAVFLSRYIYICFLLLLLLLSEGAAIPARWIDPGESFISFISSFVLFHAV
jgi:hypothetical protein